MLHLVWLILGLLAGVLLGNGRRALAGLTVLWLAIALVLLLAQPGFPLIDSVGLLSTLAVGTLSVAVGHSLRGRLMVRLPFFRR